jgi:hypothetical protein
MTAAPLIEAVRRAGGTILIRGERVRLCAPTPLPDTLIADLRQHKAEILDLLRVGGGRDTDRLTPGGSPVPSAETSFAVWTRGVERLGSIQQPQGYPERAWRQLLADAERFLDRWGMQAARLGWPAWELFGCHRQAPFGRIQGMGLVLLLRGRELVALTADEAVIRTATGAHQTYRRKPDDPLHPTGRCLVWELGDA